MRAHAHDLLDRIEKLGDKAGSHAMRASLSIAFAETSSAIRRAKAAATPATPAPATRQQPAAKRQATPQPAPAEPAGRRRAITQAEWRAIATAEGWSRNVARADWGGKCLDCGTPAKQGHRVCVKLGSGRPSKWRHFDCDNPFLYQDRPSDGQGRLI